VKNTAARVGAPTLGVVGAGRAGTALALAASSAGYRVVAVTSRDPLAAAHLARSVGGATVPTPLAVVTAADLTLLTVPDDAVTDTASEIAASSAALRGRAVVHCAASLGRHALDALRQRGADVGVLHPLQALAGAGSAALLRGSYFRVEAGGGLASDLHDLVAALGGRILEVPEEGRAVYHAAAVLAASGSLALLDTAVALFEAAGVDRADARPALAALLQGAATNATAGDAASALTGPVVRGDAGTIAAHLQALSPYPAARQLYLTIALETARLAGRDPAELGLGPEPSERRRVRRAVAPIAQVA